MTKMKVFDCQDMPEDVRKAFFDWSREGDPVGNGVYVDWHTAMWTEEAEAAGDWGMSLEMAAVFKTVNDWLLANGMDENEDVIIKHWW